MADTTPQFGQANPVYSVLASATSGDLRECADMRLAQLSAALRAIHGGGFEAFSTLEPEHMNNYLWMLHSMAEEVRDLLGAMDDATAREASHG